MAAKDGKASPGRRRTAAAPAGAAQAAPAANGAGPLPAYSLESVDRALRLLALLPGRHRLRVTDVSQELGVAPSTAHRLLSTLAYRGFVAVDHRTRTYRMGPALRAIAQAGQSEPDLPARAQPHVARLSRTLDETVNLVVLEGAFCRFVGGVPGERPLRTSVRMGAVLPSHTVSGGKVLLAELPHRQLIALFAGQDMLPMTDRTIVSLDALREELTTVRGQGYALNDGESEEGITAVAVPVRDADRVAVAALAVSAPSVRMNSQQVTAVLGPLRETAAAIGNALEEEA
ncbi:IclR family transcriptional regulator [Streptomyces sp. NPDC050560]|uniref:IclR family transcriptional regulator n=1 Tax=Streptomyces sp. NPDC050560 TaxID=3365630 RepID=UPI0037AE16C4